MVCRHGDLARPSGSIPVGRASLYSSSLVDDRKNQGMEGTIMIVGWIIARIFGNFGKVEKGVYRCAQRWYMYPVWICLGLKTRINLATNEAGDIQDRFERWLWKKLGVKYITFSTIGPNYQFEEALEALKTCDRPVLYGCEGNRDRGGGLTAVYKQEVMGCTLTEIVEDWPIFGTPGEDWLIFLFERL